MTSVLQMVALHLRDMNLPAPSVDYLLVGGGSSGGHHQGPGGYSMGGAGGGGGMLEGFDFATTPGATYSITVGAGSAGNSGSIGGQSFIQIGASTLLSALYGGNGAYYGVAAAAGGSGGGGGMTFPTGGQGTTGQGSNGGNAPNGQSGGSGGGASGSGIDGRVSVLTGETYGGGGGNSVWIGSYPFVNGRTYGNGGAGGGGTGEGASKNGTPGTGGGGSTEGAGGSGRVALRYSRFFRAATVTGYVTESIVGEYRLYQWLADGTITF